jgi:tRNA-2-methylthio-N6-dimethylallyladenosine synthase
MAGCDKAMPQVHLPVQSGSDRILEAMNRTYTLAEYRSVAARLRAAIPGLALSTDVIVGFPGETEADYEATLDLVREVRYDSAFLFKYSARPDTKAWKWDETVPEDEKTARLTKLIDLQHAISGEINDGLIGSDVEVLVEGAARRDAGQLYGKSRHFKTVVFDDDGTPPGALRRVRVLGATPITLLGESVAAPRRDPGLVQLG